MVLAGLGELAVNTLTPWAMAVASTSATTTSNGEF